MSATSTGDKVPTIVIDAGSGTFKAGFAGDAEPRACFPTVVGLPRCRTESDALTRRKRLAKRSRDREEHIVRKETVALAAVNGIGTEEALEIFEREFCRSDTAAAARAAEASLSPLRYAVGRQALDDMHRLTLSYPIERGNIVKWDEMECVYEHLFVDLLEVDPAASLALVAEVPFTSRKSRERTAELMFETFMIPGMSIVSRALLSLYGSGRTTGLVVDCGDGATHAIPVYEGYVVRNAIRRLNLGGRDVSLALARRLRGRGYHFDDGSAGLRLARRLKECAGLVGIDYARERSDAVPESSYLRTVTLPDGRVVELGKERFRASELLFRPMLAGREELGVSDLAMRAFRACDYSVRNALYGNVVLSGGSTLLEGFRERLRKDLNEHEHSFKKFTVHADEKRRSLAWHGGSLFASMSTFIDTCISYDEYEDYGSSIVHKHAGSL